MEIKLLHEFSSYGEGERRIWCMTCQQHTDSCNDITN